MYFYAYGMKYKMSVLSTIRGMLKLRRGAMIS
jgi:hypothetical protein